MRGNTYDVAGLDEEAAGQHEHAVEARADRQTDDQVRHQRAGAAHQRLVACVPGGGIARQVGLDGGKAVGYIPDGDHHGLGDHEGEAQVEQEVAEPAGLEAHQEVGRRREDERDRDNEWYADQRLRHRIRAHPEAERMLNLDLVLLKY